MVKKTKVRAQEAFDLYYENIFKERWPALKAALLQPKKHVALWNPFTDLQPDSTWNERFSGIYEAPEFLPPKLNNQGRTPYYLLDLASLAPVLALDLQGDERCLDLCAAPGGKSLLILYKLYKLKAGSLTCNELSLERRRRLEQVLKSYLPEPQVVRVTGFDGSTWGLHEKDAYDRILVDAPCSSERHLLHSPSHLQEWSPKRSKGLAVRQMGLLASAFDALKPGGRIVYSTCALSPLENDGVVKRLLERRPQAKLVMGKNFLEAEQLECGYFILPDQGAIGPIYFSILIKS